MKDGNLLTRGGEGEFKFLKNVGLRGDVSGGGDVGKVGVMGNNIIDTVINLRGAVSSKSGVDVLHQEGGVPSYIIAMKQRQQGGTLRKAKDVRVQRVG